VWKSSKLKIGIMQASRSIRIGIGASLGRYCGGQDWRLEFRAATNRKKMKIRNMDCAPILLERYTSLIPSSTRTALTPFAPSDDPSLCDSQGSLNPPPRPLARRIG